MLGFELVLLLLLLLFRLGLGLVMTVQFMTVQIKTGNHGIAAPHFWLMSIVANGWMDQDAIWYGGACRPRPYCVTWEPSTAAP